jgi:fido (protein-threonine AMPylation protein)
MYVPGSNYKWRPIQPWPNRWPSTGLNEVWDEFRPLLSPASQDALSLRIAREWSIETNLVERAFELDRGVSSEMLRHGYLIELIRRQSNGMSAEQVQSILQDTHTALDGLFSFVKSDQPLTESFIKQLHQQLMNSIEERDAYVVDDRTGEVTRVKRKLRKGEYKQFPNSPAMKDGSFHEYCPPLQVPGEMEQLIRIHDSMTAQNYPPETRAAWLHHAFTQIHPFEDGNGRVARALASLVLIKAGLPPFTVPLSMETRYLDSLLAADHGDPSLLLAFFESCLFRQSVRYWHALQVEPEPALLPPEWQTANSHQAHLSRLADPILLDQANKIHSIVRGISEKFAANPANTTYPSNVGSTGVMESWGPDFSAAPVPIQLIEIVANTEAQILLFCDRFNPQRPGLVAFSIAFKSGDQITPVFSSFFLHFKSEAPDAAFKAWLETSLKQAALMWTASL